jgi:putative ATPase
MRPRRLAEVVGHRSILGEGALLPRLIQEDSLGSLILYGPPGCGKTTLAEVIAAETGARAVRVNAVLSGAAELRDILQEARRHPERRTLLVIDEIHRFNKAQQDLLLPDVESGAVRLVGCTTHNPGHHVNPALLSRSHLLRLEPLGRDEVAAFLALALSDPERGLGRIRVGAEPGVLEMIADLSEGDLRRALNALETVALATPVGAALTAESLRRYASERRLRFDAGGDDHYDTASAFIKSVRGSDPDAALYWLAVMLEGGEDPRFIARRLLISASEDIGLADSRGLGLAVAAYQACEILGLPEAEYPLAHATLFLSLAPKSNSATLAIAAARQAARTGPRQEVPAHLRDGHGPASTRLGHGAAYLYAHGYPENVTGQAHLTRPLELFTPGAAGAEAPLSERLARLRRLRAELSRTGALPAP